MRAFIFFAVCMTGLLVSSCKVLSNRSYRQLMYRQDSLQHGWTKASLDISNLETELQQLKEQLHRDTSALIGKLNSLRAQYTASSEEAGRLAADLAEREERLREVEDILRTREEAGKALRARLENALLGFRESGLTVDMREGKVYVSLTDKLLFNTGSIVIDRKGKEALAELATVLHTQPDIHIAVEGHTDNKRISNMGQIKDNWDLSVLRATSVVRYLTQEQELDPVRLTATGKGEYQPVDTSGTADALSRNRRIEIVLSPKLDEIYRLIGEK